MTDATQEKLKTCWGCQHVQRRFRSTTPRSWCQRYHRPAIERCIDYRWKQSAIKRVLQYLKQSSIK